MKISSNKRIIKNTGLLYIRMLFTMAVSLYTSRVVLATLGVIDFGIFNVVGGVVAMISFLNVALSQSTSRFLTYELGKNDFNKLKNVFCAAVTIHIALAIFIFIIAETVGLWFLMNKMVIPEGRLSAAIWTFQFSIFTFMVSITQVPYNASIIAHENMKVYAWVSIIEVVLKLAIVYFLLYSDFDKLKFYAVLMFFVSVLVSIIYRAFCIRKYQECRYSFIWDKALYGPLINFSGWGVSGSFTFILLTQGANIILNMFFGPVVNASRAISGQVNSALLLFVQNFRTASQPQIVKLYADNEIIKMKSLVINTTKFSYFLLLLLVLPILLEAKMILTIWLDRVPDYALIFIQLTLIDALLGIFNNCFYFVFNAIGRLKENAIFTPLIGIWLIPISYLLFKTGFPPESLFVLQIIKSSILSFIVKPFLLSKYAGYDKNDFMNIFLPCIIVTIICTYPPYACHQFMTEGWFRLITVCLVSMLSVLVAVFWFGIEKELRKKTVMFIYARFKKNKLILNP